MTCPSETELLTVDQFALRLQVSRTTVFEWLKSGNLVQGTHYFKIGRILRFAWDAALLLRGTGEKRSSRKKAAPLPSRPKDQKRRRVPSQPAVNIDY